MSLISRLYRLREIDNLLNLQISNPTHLNKGCSLYDISLIHNANNFYKLLLFVNFKMTDLENFNLGYYRNRQNIEERNNKF